MELIVAEPAVPVAHPLPAVGQKVNARIDLIDDLTEDGLGWYLCAKRGEELVVRKVNKYDSGKVFIHVSHEHVTDRTFSVKPDEIDYVYPGGACAT